MKMKCISGYSSQKAQYQAGQEIEVSEAEAAFLMNDAPGCFQEAEEVQEKEFSAPVDKMERKHRTK